MTSSFSASVLAVAMATAPAVPLTAQAAPQPKPVVPAIASDWSIQTQAADKIVAQAIKETVDEIKAQEDEEASATRYDTYNVYRHRQNGQQKFEAMFIESKVPGCLRPDGLKRQSTLIFGGLLALPFVAVAALRGKCN